MKTLLFLSFSLADQTLGWVDILFVIAITVLVIFLVLFKRKELRLKEDMEKARRSEEVKATFLSHISHALRTPLNSIMTNCEKLADEKENMNLQKQKEIIDEINTDSRHLYEYINELFELSNIEGNVPKLTAIEVNLIELIMSYRREILHEVNKNVLVKIRTELSPHTRAVLDTTLVRQLIMHLLQCAARYTEEGSITIRYAEENEGLHFWIEDTGSGIPKAVCETLSSKLMNPNPDSKQIDKTTILSLSVCRAIIDAIHGKIEATSEQTENGGGTTFSFWFPCEVKNH